MDADALPPAETYEAFAARLKSREGLQFDLPQPALIGFDDLKRSQQETLVDAFSYTFTLAQILQRLHRETYTEPFKAFLETARLFAPETRLPHPVPPFVNLHRRQHLTLAQFKAKINDPSFLKCAVNWGPPGDAQDLLSPACLLLYVWLGPTWGSPLLDFAYGMCSDATKYALAWSHCVAQLRGNTGVLDVRSQGVTASANRAKGTFSTPAQVMAHLAEKVIDILDPVAQGIFTAPAFIPVTHEELTNAIRRATPAVAAASPAAQYKDLVQQHQNPTTSPPGSDDRKGRHLAQEVDAAMRNRNHEQQRAAARHLIRDTSFPEHLTHNCQRELDLDGAPGSLAHLYGLIAPVSDYRLPSSPAQAVLYLLRSHMHRLPMCNVCPASQQDSARRHAALECPTALGKLRGLGVDVGNLRRLAPENMTFFAHDPASGPPTAVPAKVTGGQHRHPNVKKRYDIHSHGKPPHRPRPSDMPSGPALPRKTNIR